jgi:hypothetical protein
MSDGVLMAQIKQNTKANQHPPSSPVRLLPQAAALWAVTQLPLRSWMLPLHQCCGNGACAIQCFQTFSVLQQQHDTAGHTGIATASPCRDRRFRRKAVPHAAPPGPTFQIPTTRSAPTTAIGLRPTPVASSPSAARPSNQGHRAHTVHLVYVLSHWIGSTKYCTIT